MLEELLLIILAIKPLVGLLSWWKHEADYAFMERLSDGAAYCPHQFRNELFAADDLFRGNFAKLFTMPWKTLYDEKLRLYEIEFRQREIKCISLCSTEWFQEIWNFFLGKLSRLATLANVSKWQHLNYYHIVQLLHILKIDFEQFHLNETLQFNLKQHTKSSDKLPYYMFIAKQQWIKLQRAINCTFFESKCRRVNLTK